MFDKQGHCYAHKEYGCSACMREEARKTSTISEDKEFRVSLLKVLTRIADALEKANAQEAK